MLAAPIVKTKIRVKWDPAIRRVVVATDDDAVFRPIGAKALFLTRSSVVVTYPRLNPLRLQATAVRSAEGSPPDALASLIRTILSSAQVTGPGRGMSTNESGSRPQRLTVSPDCPLLEVAVGDIDRLARALYGDGTQPSIGQTLNAWGQAIDAAYAAGRAGPEAIRAALTLIDEFLRDLNAGMEAARALVQKIETETTTRAPANDCEANTRLLYTSARLANPHARLLQLATLRAAVGGLRTMLAVSYSEPADRWMGDDYAISGAFRPEGGAALDVVVRVVGLDFQIDPPSGAILATEEADGQATLNIRHFSRFTQEFGVGTMIGTVTTPRYGTSTNAAGETIVVRIGQGRYSTGPAFLVSFVCVCGAGPLLAPMVQAGVSTAKEVPALLVGGGVRLFVIGRGDVALGGGWMYGWVKDLHGLNENDPVSGTRDIEASLRNHGTAGAYVSLQYRF